MSTSEPHATSESRPEKRRPRRRAMWIGLTALFLLIVTVVVGGVMAYQTFEKAQVVRAKLTEAIPLVGQMRDQLTSFDTAGSTATAGKLAVLTADAREQTDDTVWRIMEAVPVLGPNLSAVRTATEVADDISTGIVTPLASTSIDQLKPVDSRIDLAAFTSLAEKIRTAKTTVDSAEQRISGIDRGALLPEVASAIDQIRPQLTQATEAMDAIEPITSILPDSLGASGPRQYLVLFQNLAEAQSLGGGTAALMLLRVEDGSISIAQQANSSDFSRRLDPPVTVDASALNTFGTNLGFDLNTSTVRPDFPTAASISTQFWERTYPETGAIDGVLAIDPRALSYLIGATGDITLLDGTVLTADNTVKTLLHDVYYRETEDTGTATDAFFQMAAGTIFQRLLSGAIEPSKMLPAIVKGVDEDRILAFSNDADEQALLAATPIAGTLPTDNSETTTTGVYFQDASEGSKMDYYLESDVKQSTANLCAASGATIATTVTLANTISERDAARLPDYVAAKGSTDKYPRGDFLTNVYVYGPPGTTLTGVTWGNQTAGSSDTGATDDLGRPVARLRVYLQPGERAAFTVDFAATGGDYSAAAVATTPTLNPTTVEITDDPSCPLE